METVRKSSLFIVVRQLFSIIVFPLCATFMAAEEKTTTTSSRFPFSGWTSGLNTVSMSPAAPLVTDCPRACFCNTLNKIVYCSRRGLMYIPDGIPADSVQININGNAFVSSTIRRSNFSKFVELEHLYLSECGIEKIEVGVFADLVNLKWLDMSNNRIKAIEENTFRGTQLQHLFLNGNRHIRLLPGSFEGLATTGLYLHDCSLNDIQMEVLRPLSQSIRYLWLNGNELERMDNRLFELFSTLQHLRINSNPLRCDCDTLWLKELFDRNVDTFRGAPPPSCLTPSKLRGRLFNESTPNDFLCRLPMFTHVEATFNGSSGGLRCAAVGDPAPILYWVQPSGKISVYDRPLDSEKQYNEGFLSMYAELDDVRIFGMFICIATNIAGNVTFSINLPRPVASSKISVPSLVSVVVPPSTSPYPNRAAHSPVYPGRQLQRGTTSSPGRSSRTPFMSNAFAADKFAGSPTALRRLNVDVIGLSRPPNDDAAATIKPTNPPRAALLPAGTGVVHRSSQPWTERTFTFSELVGAAVGTHICTIVMYVIIVGLCYWVRCRARRHIRRVHQHHQRSGGGGGGGATFLDHKATLSPCSSLLQPDAVYFNGLGRCNVLE